MSDTPPVRVKADVRRVWMETPKLKGVVLEVPEETAKKYVQPGQFVVLYPKADGRVYLVIASAPGEARAIELLLASAADQTLSPEEGGTIELDPPAGSGFPMDVLRGRDVLLFATGSAIAAIRPVVEVIRKERSEYGRVTLYAGAHTNQDFPYGGSFDMWKRDRIDLVRAISKPWVQHLFEKDPVPVENATAFVCGGKQMMDDTTAILVKAGLPLDRIRRNW